MATEGFASQLERVADHAKETLADLGYPWALVGGLAVSARAEPRFTRDVDFAVALKSDREAEALILAVQARGYRIDTVLEQETTGRLATVRLVAPGSGKQGVILDLLFASSGIEPEVVERATVIGASATQRIWAEEDAFPQFLPARKTRPQDDSRSLHPFSGAA